MEGMTRSRLPILTSGPLKMKLNRNPYIDHVDAYINIKRDLIVNIKEREAILRIYLPDNSSFYMDRNGNLFPLMQLVYTPSYHCQWLYQSYSNLCEHQHLRYTLY